MNWDEFVMYYNMGHEFSGTIEEEEFRIIQTELGTYFVLKDGVTRKGLMLLTDYNAKHCILHNNMTLYELFENKVIEIEEMF